MEPPFRGQRAPVKRRQAVAGCYLIRPDRTSPGLVSGVIAPLRGERLAGSRLLAFAGIGRPEKFFATLRALGAVLVGTRAFPDHHPFRVAELEGLRRDAEHSAARLITTSKDIVREPLAQRAGIEVLEVEIRWPDPIALGRHLSPVVRSVHDDGRELAKHLG